MEVEKEIPVNVIRGNATYLLWVDCSEICDDANELVEFIKKETGLRVTAGDVYRSSTPFIRVNIACPNERMKDGINRFILGVKKYLSKTE